MQKLNKLPRTFKTVLLDETGAEVIEYALVLGVVIVAAVATIGAIGTKVLARWASINSSM